MTQEFVAAIAQLHPEKHYTGAAMGIFRPGDYARTRFPTMKGTALFTYCFRRFGYPSEGWDDSKELCRYTLTTPEADVFLTISPHIGGSGNDAWLSFGYCIEQGLHERLLLSKGHTRWKQQSPLYRRGAIALERAMDDLLRPVNIRDVLIDCCGSIEEEEDIVGRRPSRREPYHAAGYGIPRDFLADPDRYGRFLDALRAFGEGSLGAGMERLIEEVKEGRKEDRG